MTNSNFDSILTGIADWAADQPAVAAVIVVGSQGRRDRPADRWSDLDLVVYTPTPLAFIEDGAWISRFGIVWAQAVEHTPRGDPEWFVFFAGGRKVDILFVDTRSLSGNRLYEWVQHPDFAEVYARGVRVLYNTTPGGTELPEIPIPQAHRAPTQPELDRLVNRFYLAAARAGRLLFRKDLWRARQAVDEELKLHLLTMIEWHAISKHRPDYDVWYDGRFLADWADPNVRDRLPDCFGGFHLASLWQAFMNTMALFDDLGEEVAAGCSLQFPRTLSANIRTWLKENEV